MFGEWKYNRVSFNFSDSTPTAATGGLKGDYSRTFLHSFLAIIFRQELCGLRLL